MRRLLSILFVLVFSLGPLAALQAGDDARLPACCRRHGAHHCAMAMRMAVAASGKSAFRAPNACPRYPGYLAPVIPSQHALPQATAALTSQPARLLSPSAAHAAARSSCLRSRSSRAPPQLILT